MAIARRNPWVAVDVATDRVAHARRLRAAHEHALSGTMTPGDVRDVVLDSWRRSLAAGVRPTAPGAPAPVDSDTLEAARATSPLALATEAIFGALSSLDGDAQHVIAISDAHATLLWVTGDPDVLDRARGMHFEEGAAWSEAAAGTNAVGTAAALDHEVQIFSAEHLVEAVHGWTCAAAPIHDPISGDLIGVIDLTAPLRTAHPHTLSLAVLAARAAESTLYAHELRAAARLLEQWHATIARTRAAAALVDRHGRLVATRGATRLPARLGDETIAEVDDLDGGGKVIWLRDRRRYGPPGRRDEPS